MGFLQGQGVAVWRRWLMLDWRWLWLFWLLSSLYFATASGITSSNDGSHYALTRTLAENGHFTLDAFDDYAEGNDVAIRDGRLYSDRPPGTAVAATLFYLVGQWLPHPLTPLSSRHDAANPRLLYVLLLPVWAGAGTAVLLYRLLRRQNLPPAPAFLTVLMGGLGTIQWKYSTVLFSHALSGFLVLLAVSLALDAYGRADLSVWRYLALGFVLGYSVVVEYSNLPVVGLMGLYLLAGIRPFRGRRLALVGLSLFLGGIGPAIFLAYYNTVNFGSPFTLSYAYALNYPWAGEFASTFSTPWWPGLKALVWWGEGGGWCGGPCYNQGILLLSPVLWTAVPGLWLYWRQARRESMLTLGLFAFYLALFSRHYTAHGFTGDGRYLAPFLGLLTLPLGFSLAWLWARRGSGWGLAGETAVLLLFALSLRNMALHIGFSYNYHLDLSQLSHLIAAPANWHYLVTQLFPNAGNLPLLWLLELVSGLLLGILALSRKSPIPNHNS